MENNVIQIEKLPNNDQIIIDYNNRKINCFYLHENKKMLLANIDNYKKITIIHPLNTRFETPLFLHKKYDVYYLFVERRKRMTMDDDDFTLDLLFYHRILKRLVAIELKIGKFIPQYKGQMEFYLKWLNKYERQDDENEPIGIILCTKASRNQIDRITKHE